MALVTTVDAVSLQRFWAGAALCPACWKRVHPGSFRTQALRPSLRATGRVSFDCPKAAALSHHPGPLENPDLSYKMQKEACQALASQTVGREEHPH